MKVAANPSWALEPVGATVVLSPQSNKPLQRTGPAPALGSLGLGEPAPQLNVMYVGRTGRVLEIEEVDVADSGSEFDGRRSAVLASAIAVGTLIPLTLHVLFLEMWSGFDGPAVGILGDVPGPGSIFLLVALILLAAGAALYLLARLHSWSHRLLGLAGVLVATSSAEWIQIPELAFQTSWAIHCAIGNHMACRAADEFRR